MTNDNQFTILKPDREVGIVGYGAYVPRYRLPAAEVDRIWMGERGSTPIKEKSVPGLDEDVATMSIEAARNALARADLADPALIRAVWVGSESHPYAVKPTSTIVAEVIGATPLTQAGDWEFACKAGSEAFQAAVGFVGSGMAQYALAIGMDTAQARPGDALEYTAAAGGAAYLVGPAEESLAVFEGSLSYVTDTPDQGLMEALGREAADYKYAVFHQPNVKFPRATAKRLGFTPAQYEIGLLVNEIGNTYAGSSLVGLTAALDVAAPGDLVLVVSYGSGAGSDAISFRITDAILERQRQAPLTRDYIARRVEIDYATYVKFTRKLRK